MSSSSGSSGSDDGEIGLGKPRPESSESTEDKVVEKSPKGRFHRVRSKLFPERVHGFSHSLIADSEVVHIKPFIWLSTTIRVGKWHGMLSVSRI